MSAQIDCPICMDCIESTTKNCVTTECGHCFHANCLMQSVAHNGFGCPYCRTKMAEEPEEEDYSVDEYSIEDDDTVFDDDALTSFRMFNQRINGEEVEEEPEEWETDDEDEDEDEEEETQPNAVYVAQKLLERGITFEDLVKNILYQEHSNYGTLYMNYERRSCEIFGQFRAAITQYRNSGHVREAPKPSATVDFEAQPKIININRIIMDD